MNDKVLAGGSRRVEIRLDIAEAQPGGDSDVKDALTGNQRIAVLVDRVDEKMAVIGVAKAEERVSPTAGEPVGRGRLSNGCPRKKNQGQQQQSAQAESREREHRVKECPVLPRFCPQCI